jgi:hypothetical protein
MYAAKPFAKSGCRQLALPAIQTLFTEVCNSNRALRTGNNSYF